MLRSSTCSPSRSLGPPGPERDRRLPVARGGELAAPPHGARRPVCQSGRCVGPPLDRPLPDCRQPAAPHTNRFFSLFFHPEADWADSLTISGRTTGSSPNRTWSERQCHSCAPPARMARLSAPLCHRPRGGISYGPGPAGPMTWPTWFLWAPQRTLFPARPGTQSSHAVTG